MKLQEQMRANDPFLKLQEQLRRSDLFHQSQETISLQLATALAFVAEQESIIDLSLADDSNLTPIDPFQKFYLFVQNLYDAIREQIQATQASLNFSRYTISSPPSSAQPHSITQCSPQIPTM